MTLYEAFKQVSEDELARGLTGMIANAMGIWDPVTIRRIYTIVLEKLNAEME